MLTTREQRVAERIQGILDSASTRTWQKSMLELAILRDPVDAANDIDFLLELAQGRAIKSAAGQGDEKAPSSIDARAKIVLGDNSTSHWLKTAILMVLEVKPAEAVDQVKLLADVLGERCKAILDAGADAHPPLAANGQFHLGLTRTMG